MDGFVKCMPLVYPSIILIGQLASLSTVKILPDTYWFLFVHCLAQLLKLHGVFECAVGLPLPDIELVDQHLHNQVNYMQGAPGMASRSPECQNKYLKFTDHHIVVHSIVASHTQDLSDFRLTSGKCICKLVLPCLTIQNPLASLQTQSRAQGRYATGVAVVSADVLLQL